MTATTEPAAPHHPGRWPTGAWFGCQLGGTAWLLTGAAELCQTAPPLAAAWALLWATANALGWRLWRRHRAGWPGAAPLMLLGCGAVGLVALVALDVVRPASAEAGVPAAGYLIVAGVPAVVAALIAVRPRSAVPAVSAEGVRA